MQNKAEITQRIKSKALEVGFNAVGISKAERLVGFDTALEQWLQNHYHGNMGYMERNKEKRVDPSVLVEGGKSVISLIISYFPESHQSDEYPKVAKYAYGIDYHIVLKDKMKMIWDDLETLYPELNGRMFVDSAPVSDKLWAVNGGLGWIGKNSCLINKEIGSFVFVCELIVNIDLDYDEPYRSNFCGSCTKCIDACPTGAIVQPTVIDSKSCISYQTIENKEDNIPAALSGKFENRLFGCDICQDVCPWNKKPIITNVEEFKPLDFIIDSSSSDWEKLEKDEFGKVFKNSPLKRSKFEGISRNLSFIKG